MRLAILGATIVALSYYGAHFINPLTRAADWPYQILLYVTLDTLTACVFLAFFPARIAISQAIILLLACINNLLLYWDLVTGGNVVYTSWETHVKLLTYLQFVALLTAGGDDRRRHTKHDNRDRDNMANMDPVYATAESSHSLPQSERQR